MKFNPRLFISLACLITPLLLVACGAPGTSNGSTVPGAPLVTVTAPLKPIDRLSATPVKAVGDASSPLQLTLSLERLPQVGDEVNAVLTLKAVRAVPQVTATLLLPASVKVVSGETTWQGDLTAEQSVTLQSRLHFTTGGNLELSGHTRHEFENGDVWADLATLYINLPEPDHAPVSGTPTPPEAVPAS